MFEEAKKLITNAQKIIVIQGENPDGDSLGSAIALEEILGDLGKDVSLYCDVQIPSYLHYITGWDRVTPDFDTNADLAIIVDTSAETLISKSFEIPGVRHFYETHPVLVLDHHVAMDSTLQFDHTFLNAEAVATGELLYYLASNAGWHINQPAAEALFAAIQSDSLGLSTEATNAKSYHAATELVKLGVSPAVVEARRRELMKKPQRILAYKGQLIGRIEYLLDGALALVHIPWEEIQEYSDAYNPSVLVMDEMRLVEGVQLAVAIKTYPDGKLTGKLRANLPIAEQVAGFFGGGGHAYAAGFRVYENYDKIVQELVEATDKALMSYEKQYDNTQIS